MTVFDDSYDVQNQLKELTNKVAETVYVLKYWKVLDFTGHFIDLDPEMRERVNEIVKLTDEVLAKWGIKVPE